MLKRLLVLAVLPLIWPAGPAFAQDLVGKEAELPTKSILILHSGYDGDPWVQTLREGFRRGVSPQSGSLEIWTEYLGFPRVRWAGYLDDLANHYSEKYRGHRFDLVITDGRRALEFVDAHRNLPFFDTAVVFSGVDSDIAARYGKKPRISGVAAPMDFRGTLDLAFGLHPEVREIVFISPGFENRPMIEPLIVEYRPDLPMSLWHDDYLSAIEARLKAVGENAVVVPLGVPLDSSGRPVDVRTFVRRLSALGKAPVYSVWDVLLGHGVVGGRMVDRRAHGETLGKLALKVLAGGSDAATVDEVTPARDMFDYVQLQRFGIEESALPKGSVVVNLPRRLLEVARSVIFAAVGVIVFLLALVLVLLINIIQRRAAQDALKVSERRLDLALQVSRDGLWDWNLLTGEWYFSPRWCESLQLDPAKVAPRLSTWEERIHPQDLDGVHDAIDRHLRGETEGYESEHRVLAGSGEYRWHRSRGKVVETTDNARPARMIGVEIDITDRKLAEDELRESRKQLQLIADNVPGLLVRIGVDRRVRFINREAEEWFGLESEAVVGKHIREIIGEDAYETAQSYIARVLAGETTSFEMERPYKYGPVRWASGTFAPDFDEHGGVRGYYALLTDITEHKRAQDEVKRAQVRLLEQQRHQQDSVRNELNRVRDELVRKTRLAAIGQVAASIAHDLRNPLGAIRNVKFYLNRKLPKDEPKWKEYLDIMEREIVVADTIINGLVDMSRTKSPDKSDLDLEKALRDSFRRVNGNSKIEFDCVFDHRPFTVYADPGHLGRVLDNLITNAIQAMGDGGKITVNAQSGSNFDTIRVRDEGPGVAREIRKRIFEPLVTGKAKGTGLGLSICRQIVESHGGRIDLLRSDAAGAEFEIRLPRRMAAPMEVNRA
jgi:PAS domain S-box-containing protein